jgi:MFS family permease
MLAAVFIFSLGNSSDMFLVLRAQESGIAASYAPLLGLVFNITYTALSYPAGKLADKMPKRGVAAAGYLVYAAVYATFALALSHASLWIAMSSYGLYYSLTGPVLRALVMEEVAPEMRGRAAGLLLFVTSVCTLTASAATGWLWTRFGGELPLGIAAGCATIAAIMLLLARKPRLADR